MSSLGSSVQVRAEPLDSWSQARQWLQQCIQPWGLIFTRREGVMQDERDNVIKRPGPLTCLASQAELLSNLSELDNQLQK